jgi:hypothetical protein
MIKGEKNSIPFIFDKLYLKRHKIINSIIDIQISNFLSFFCPIASNILNAKNNIELVRL